MNIDKVINNTVERYEKILNNYYPSFGSIGFTERNLTPKDIPNMPSLLQTFGFLIVMKRRKRQKNTF